MVRPLLVPLLLLGSVAAQTPIPAGKLPVPGDASHELQLYDLGSLIEARADFRRGPDEAGPALAEFARAFVMPSLEHAEDVKALGARHIVGLGRAEVHGWVQGFLQVQLDHGEDPIDLQFRVLNAHDKALQRAELKRDPVIVADADALKARLKKLHGTPLLHHLTGEPEVTEMTAPRLLTLQLQRAHISVASQVQYIKGYVASGKPGQPNVPQREIVSDGIVLACRAALVQEDRIGLFCKIEVTELDQPIAQEQTPLGPIGVPVTHKLEFERDLQMPAGGGVLLPLRRDDGRHLVVVVTANSGA